MFNLLIKAANGVIDPEVLKDMCYFEGCSSAELRSIRRYITRREVRRRETVVFQGDPCDTLYFVASGGIKVYKTSVGGKEQILHIAQKGESIGDIGVFDGGPAPASMMAITATTLYQIKKKDLDSVILKYPRVALNALRALATRVRRDSRLVEELSFGQVVNRVARLLLKYMEWETGSGIRLTQQDMANMVGSSREMVNKSLRYMEDQKALRTTRKGIEIMDGKTLENIAQAIGVHSSETRDLDSPL